MTKLASFLDALTMGDCIADYIPDEDFKDD